MQIKRALLGVFVYAKELLVLFGEKGVPTVRR